MSAKNRAAGGSLRLAREGAFRLPQFDGFRGFLIVYIIALHTRYHAGDAFIFPWIGRVIDQGYLAVPLFFVLSGFVICRSLEITGHAAQSGWVADFYVRRAIRILPLWWAGVLLYWIFQKFSFIAAVKLMTFGFGFHMRDISDTPMHHGWSLFVEEVFYLFFPLIFLACKRLRAAAIFWAILFVFAVIARFQADLNGWNHFMARAVIFNLHYFLLGIFLYRLTETSFWQRVKGETVVLVSLEISLALIAFVFILGKAAEWMVPISFFVFLSLQAERTSLHRICRSNMMQGIGVLSYAMYIVNFVLLWFLIKNFHFFFPGVALGSVVPEVYLLVSLPIVIFFCASVALFLHLVVERWFGGYLKRCWEAQKIGENEKLISEALSLRKGFFHCP